MLLRLDFKQEHSVSSACRGFFGIIMSIVYANHAYILIGAGCVPWVSAWVMSLKGECFLS